MVWVCTSLKVKASLFQDVEPAENREPGSAGQPVDHGQRGQPGCRCKLHPHQGPML